MHEATTYQDQPITGGPITLQVQMPNSLPVMVSLRMALGMVAFGVSVVALGFALVFGEGNPWQAKARLQRTVLQTAVSTSVGRNPNAPVSDASVAAFVTARAQRGANAQIELQTPSCIATVLQATTRSARPSAASSTLTIESAESNRKRRGAFYEDIPSGKSLKRP